MPFFPMSQFYPRSVSLLQDITKSIRKGKANNPLSHPEFFLSNLIMYNHVRYMPFLQTVTNILPICLITDNKNYNFLSLELL